MHEIIITESGDEIPSQELVDDETHHLSVDTDADADNGDVYLNFSSRLAMYDFARSLLHEAIYGKGGIAEFRPFEFEGKMEVIDGVRMSSGSARMFIFYQEDTMKVHNASGLSKRV
jgi:hypothetical protein